MTTPDLAALRLLIERAERTTLYCSCYKCEAVAGALPAAKEALERLEHEADREGTTVITAGQHVARSGATEAGIHVPAAPDTGLPSPKNSQIQTMTLDVLKARLARLEGARAEAVRLIRGEGDPDVGRPWLVEHVLTILDSGEADRDTTEWQRVHGPVIQGDAAVTFEASAQAARDVAHWRKRAEDAEARAVREGRDE